MYIKLIRKRFEEEYTEGEMYIDDELICKTLEDKDRDLSDDMPIEDIKAIKVYGKTAIPTGVYHIVMDIKSPNFSKRAYYRDYCGGYLPRLTKVKGFTGILIHRGKTAEHSLGCILVGEEVNNGVLSGSKEAFEKLYAILDKAHKDKDKICIEIV